MTDADIKIEKISRHYREKLAAETVNRQKEERISKLEEQLCEAERKLEKQLEETNQAKKEAEEKAKRAEEEKTAVQRDLDKTRKTLRELEKLKVESGAMRTSYLLEPHELIDSTLRSINETLKKFQLPTGYGYGMPVSEESLAAEAFIRRNSYWPNSIARPAKRIRKNLTPEELDRMDVRASAAEKRLKGAH